MQITPGLCRFATSTATDVLESRICDDGWKVFVLKGAVMRDAAGLFDAIRAALPLDPPIERLVSWDALEDSIWEGLMEIPAKRIAVLWLDFNVFHRAAPTEAKLFSELLEGISASLANPQFAAGTPKQVAIVLHEQE